MRNTLNKFDTYLAESVAPIMKNIFTNEELSQGSVIVDPSGLECEFEVWTEIPLSGNSTLQLLAVHRTGNVVVKARFEIDPLDKATLLVDGHTPPTENFLWNKWVISRHPVSTNIFDPQTSNLEFFLQANSELRLVWDLEEIVRLLERNQLGNADYVRGIRIRWEAQKRKVEDLCGAVWFGFRQARWLE